MTLRIASVCAIAVLFTLPLAVEAQSRGRGETVCPSIIANRRTGEFNGRSGFRCFNNTRAAQRAGFSDVAIHALPTDLSGRWKLHVLPKKSGCTELLGPQTIELNVKQVGTDLVATTASNPPQELRGFRIASQSAAVLARGFSLACDGEQAGVTNGLLTVLLEEPVQGSFSQVTVKMEQTCGRYCADILEGTAERE